MIKVKFFFALFLLGNCALAMRAPHPDSLHITLLTIAEAAKIDPNVIKQYKRFKVNPNDIEKIEKGTSEIIGAHPFSAILKDGNTISATYYSSGPNQGRAWIYATYYQPDESIVYLPLDTENYCILRNYFYSQRPSPLLSVENK